MSTDRLRVEIPGNPWAGAINRRDRAAVSTRGKLFNRKLPGFAAYMDDVALWTRQAVMAQGVAFGSALVEVWISLVVPDRRRRDLDGPIKAILDGATTGGAWADDSQVGVLHVRRVLDPGQTRAVLVVRRLTQAVPGC